MTRPPEEKVAVVTSTEHLRRPPRRLQVQNGQKLQPLTLLNGAMLVPFVCLTNASCCGCPAVTQPAQVQPARDQPAQCSCFGASSRQQRTGLSLKYASVKRKAETSGHHSQKQATPAAGGRITVFSGNRNGS
ncbi:hypothetical protein WJX77_011230 [Trebouxia sp. C0004]